jgi:hypothetical protein
MTRARILKLAGGAVLGIVALDVVATVLTLAFGWEFLKR